MIVIVGTIRIPAGRLGAARETMERMILASRAEPGCLDYAYSVDVLDETLVHVTERWADGAALEAHFASSHIAAWRTAWQDLGITDRRLSRYDTSGPEPT